MRWSSRLTSAVVRASLLSVALAAIISDANAALSWEKTTVDRDAAINEEIIQTAFPFKNSGSTTITISSIQTSCGCTAASLEKKTYAPGEAGQIKVTFSTVGFVGQQEKTITVVTAEEPKKPTVLALRVKVPEPYSVSPRFVAWTLGEKPEERAITIRVHPGLKSEPSLPVPLPEGISARLAAGPEQDTYQLWLKPISTQENFHAVVQLRIERANLSPLSVGIYAQVR